MNKRISLSLHPTFSRNGILSMVWYCEFDGDNILPSLSITLHVVQQGNHTRWYGNNRDNINGILLCPIIFFLWKKDNKFEGIKRGSMPRCVRLFGSPWNSLVYELSAIGRKWLF